MSKTAEAYCERLPQKMRKGALLWGGYEKVLRSEAVAPLECVRKQILTVKS